MEYDVVVVGARVAGSATAMLLARQGLRVLVLDRATFPSDTISSHQVQVPGMARLHRWGLLDRIRAAGTPATRQVRFDAGDVVLHGCFPEYEGVDELHSPRRTLLDALLVEAARAAGAEVREGFRVESLVRDDDGRVRGIRGRDNRAGAVPVTHTATLVVGADGKRSLVADAVGARRYRTRPALSFASYGYWAGVPLTGGEFYQRPGLAVAAFPTNDDLTMVYLAAPMAEFPAYRGDIEPNYLAALDRCGDLSERVRAGVRAERLRTTPDQPNTLRVPHGPGWALVGDAGAVMDSISAQGITHALRDAERLSAAVVAGLGGRQPLAAALAGHQRRRDRAILKMYDFTVRLARHRPAGALQRRVLAAVADRPGEADRFLGAFAGITPIDRYFSLATAMRLSGARSFSCRSAAPRAAARRARCAGR